MDGHRLLFTIILFSSSNFAIEQKCEDRAVQSLCLDQESCDACLQAHECCHWCYDQSFTGRKCNTNVELECRRDQIEFNEDIKVEVPNGGNKDFTRIDKDTKLENVIQMKPQFANIRLRPGVPVNFSFAYKPAENYPLELYYLGDLSKSMYDSLEIFKTIGTDLPNKLTSLTENYKLAFGSFIDKTAMPFFFTDESHLMNPCKILDLEGTDCETGYLYKHRLNFTSNVNDFTNEIINSKITANLDDLDGALDAVWQILNCNEQIGGSTFSRKIILLPTDSLLHMAGDGILAGAVLRPIEECLLDEVGNHKDPLKYDYPSLSEIDKLLKEKKVNIIFAVKNQNKREYYKNLTEDLIKDSAFVGELDAGSRNILELITIGYYNFARQVSFYINTTSTPNIDVKFFASCENNGLFNESSVCYDVQDQAVNFIVQLTLNEQPTNAGNVNLYVEEKNIYEKITLNISYRGSCNCDNYQGIVRNCVNGVFVCGYCTCSEGWTGPLCDQECNEGDTLSCRMPSEPLCSGRGDCHCGQCKCDFPYEGKYCQNYCPNSDFQICGGPSRGTCSDGRCVCKPGYKGEDCTCSMSVDNCKLLNTMELCSNNGECECNTCKCNEGFSGEYCEIRADNNTLCEDYKPFVEEALINGTFKFKKDGVSLQVEEYTYESTNRLQCNTSACDTIIFQGSSRCTVDFCYYANKKENKINLIAAKNCIFTAQFQALSIGLSVLLAIVLGGLIIIGIFKWRIHRAERAEYKKFMEESKNTTEMNPIYKNPVTEYRNPLRKD